MMCPHEWFTKGTDTGCSCDILSSGTVSHSTISFTTIVVDMGHSSLATTSVFHASLPTKCIDII